MVDRRHRSAAAREVGGLDAVAALRHARRVARLSQRDLARRAGVSQSLIARIEARRVDPPVGQLQRLLAHCGMRWDLHLIAAGATPAVAGARGRVVRARARHREETSGDRRMRENAAARHTAESATDPWVSGREVRRRCRAARLAERATQNAQYAAIIRADDDEATGWVAADTAAAQRWCRRAVLHTGVPLSDRLTATLDDPKAADLRTLLTGLAHSWTRPPLALTGPLARAVWSPGYRLPTHPTIDLATLRGPREAQEFLTAAGATPAGGPNLFTLGGLRLRLLPTAPQSASLVRWQPGTTQALVVARPESPTTACDRHTIRAALTTATRDHRGRRRPPYHETWDGAVRPWWS